MRRRNNLACAGLALALLLAAPAEASRRKEIILRLYDDVCIAAAVPAPLPAAWLAHRAEIQDCAVTTMERRHVLTVRTVRVPKGAPPPAPLPTPLLLDLSGRVLGQLPGIWPGPDPDMTFLYFTRWRADFPERIEMKTLDATTNRMTVTKTTYAPLIWNPTRKLYEPGR